MARRPLLACLTLVAVALAACGGDDDERDEVERTVRDFVTATNERDGDTFCGELVTQEFLEQSTGAKGDQAEEACKEQLESVVGIRLRLVRIRETEVDGDRARVSAVLEAQGQRQPARELRLVRQDGDWKLAGGTGG